MTTEPLEDAPGRWARTELIALVAIAVLAALLRFINLADPAELVFDETYYAKDACFYTGESPVECGFEGSNEQTAVHPPLGKWMIAAGVEIFGYDSFGYRVVPALAGTLTVILLFVLARRLTRSLLVASLAAGLLAFDPLHFVQSRVSMLDIFLPLFGVAAVLFLAIDRDRLIARLDEPPGSRAPRRALWGRPWRIAAGAAAGAAIATKWSGGLILLLVVVLALSWETASRPEGSRLSAFGRTLKQEWPALLLWFVLLPVAVYLISYIGRLDGQVLAWPWSEGSFLRNLGARHEYMYSFHKDLEATHSYQSPAWSWILIRRPVSYFFCSGADCTPPQGEGIYQEIFATGSPFVWWSSLLAIGYLAVTWIRKRDFRRPDGLVLAGFGLTYLPWIVISLIGISDRSAVFLFYLLPTVPFMMLALAVVATRIGDSWEAKSAIALFAVGSVGLFFFYYPLLAKRSLPEPEWRRRIWIFDDCDREPGKTVETVTETKGGATSVTTSEGTGGEDKPPRGWCWI